MTDVLKWIAVIVVVLWVVKDPAGAAAFVQHIGHALTTLAGAL